MSSHCVIVLGQHRSGTSMVAGMVKRLGVQFPEDDLGTTEHNPLEYNESASLTEAIEDGFEDVWDWVEANRKEGLWGVKDPRMCDPAVLDNFLDALEHYRIEYTIVAVRRSLEAVKRSLLKYGHTHEKAQWYAEENFALWKKSCVMLEPELVLKYEDIVDAPTEAVLAIADVLEHKPSEDQIWDAIAFVDPSLDRSSESPRAVFYSYPDAKGGSAYWRCRLPSYGTGAGLFMREADGNHVYGSSDIELGGTVIYQQPTSAWQLDEIREMQMYGLRVILNIDDYLWSIAKRQDRRVAKHFTKTVLANHLEALKLAHGVVVTNQWLADRLKLKSGNKPYWVIPHMVDLNRYEKAKAMRTERGLAVFQGGMGHEDALGDFIRTHNFDKIYDGDYRLRVVGHDYTKQIGGSMPEGGEFEYVTWTRDMTQYPEHLGDAEVGIAPSLDNDFYRAKSDLRLREYAACGIPRVWSYGPTYAGTDYDRLLNGGLEEDNERAIELWNMVIDGEEDR